MKNLATADTGGGIDRSTGRVFGGFASRHVLIGTLLSLALSSILFTAGSLWNSGNRLLDHVAAEVGSRVQLEMSEKVERFLRTSNLIERHILSAFRSGQVRHDDEEALRRLFLDFPRPRGDTPLSAVHFGDQDGRYVGLDVAPGGSSGSSDGWRLSVVPPAAGGSRRVAGTGADEQAGTRVGGDLDPRYRPWYRAAARFSGSVWTGLDEGSTTITRSVALRDDDSGALLGVVGIDLSVSHLRRALAELELGDSGAVFVADSDGMLIGLRTGTPEAEGVAVPTGTRRISASESSGRFVRAMSARIDARHGGFGRVQTSVQERLVLDGEPGYFLLSPVGGDQGLSWSLGVFVPESDYAASVPSRLARLLPAVLLSLLAVSAAFAVLAALVLRPLRRLGQGARRIAVGEFDVAIDTSSRNEVGELARSMDDMRRRLRTSFDTLVEQRLIAEVTLESIADGVVTIDASGKVRYMNAVAERLTGTDLDEARGKSIEHVFQARDERTGLPMTRGLMLRSLADAHTIGQPVVVTSASGSTHLVHCRVTPVTDEEGRGHGGVLNFSDLSEELRLKSELVHRATHDPLTDLVNRREFERRTTLALGNARRRGTVHTLCYVDLDRFKLVNDSAGHSAGDELLRQIARLLDENVRGGDTVARLGGDEFGVLLEHCTLERAERIMENLRERIEAFRFHWEGRSYSIGLSAGLVAISEVSVSAITAMRDADSACYIAKNGGRGRVHVHREDDEALVRLRDDHSWIERIERALEHDRFRLRAQRIESADIGETGHRHVEILLRLIGDEGEELSPAEFLPAAERYSLASRLDRWVVSNAIDWLVSSAPGGEVPDLCSINLSGQSLGEPAMLPFIVSEIRRSGVSPLVICFEVTETAAIANLSNALNLIATLRELGCSFALDDFGSGLSSFAYLKTLPVDYLKIDGVFVRDMLDDPLDLAMVRSINEVGQTMGMRTVAEYVENDALREALRELGVDYVQGYGVGRPEPLDGLAFATSAAKVI